MKKLLLLGRSGCGKTMLANAVSGKKATASKTQYIGYSQNDTVIDTPGEYLQNKWMPAPVSLYICEADVVAFVVSSAEPFSLFPPGYASVCNRPVIGIVTDIHNTHGKPDNAEHWLRIAGCEKIFRVDSATGEGITDIQKITKQ